MRARARARAPPSLPRPLPRCPRRAHRCTPTHANHRPRERNRTKTDVARPTLPPLSIPDQASAGYLNDTVNAKAAAVTATVDFVNKVDDAKANATATLFNKVNMTALLAKLEAAAAKPNATLPLTLPVTKANWTTKVMGTKPMVGK